MLKLPVDSYLEEIYKILCEKGTLVLSAETGAGKSTRIPAHLYKKFVGRTLVLQPRRVAARMLAQRVCEEENSALGQAIGYHVRHDYCANKQTKLLYITEGLLNRYITEDPFLEGIELVILDEFHERSVHSDLALLLLRQIKKELNPNLKILVMSATLDCEPLADYLFQAPVLKISGRSFGIEQHYLSKIEDPLNLEEIFQKVSGALTMATQEHPQNKGHILIFLAGQREIEHCVERLQKTYFEPQWKVLPLYASLPEEKIRTALNPTNSLRKIILATNIAETSITLEGLDTVIDSGLKREAQVSWPHLTPKIITTRISQAEAQQRAGRAGRQQKGLAYALWATHDTAFLKPQATPDIHKSDLSTEMLQLLEFGFKGHPQDFPWFEKPRHEILSSSFEKIQTLELDQDAKRKRILNSPLGLRGALFLDKVLEEATFLNQEALLWALGLEEIPTQFRKGDYETVLSKNKSYLLNGLSFKKLNKKFSLDPKNIDRQIFIRALFSAFKDRVGKIRASEKSKIILWGERGARLEKNLSIPLGHPYIVALDIRDAENKNEDSVVSLFVSLANKDFENFFKNEIISKTWEKAPTQNPLDLPEFYSASFLGKLPLTEAHRIPPTLKTLHSYFLKQTKDNWQTLQGLCPTLSEFSKRVELYRPELLSPAHFSDETHEIIGTYKTLQEWLESQEIKELILSPLSYSERKDFNERFPEHYPTSRGPKKLRYESPERIILSLRLQDALDWKTHPHIDMGRIPLTLELLSPAQRPLQITQDIVGFWKGSYQEIRKEMKARYPKHNWPENL
jgi:ATP-dependent helicase HrpB